MPQTSFLREYYMEVIKLNQLNNYGVSERFFTEATLYPEYQLARVIAQYRGKYKIVTEQGEMLAEISGKLRYDTEELAQYPAVGDCVMVDIQPELAVIHRVLTRKSLFVRKAVGVSGQAQPVAANVDIVFLCMSLNQNFSLNRMERYLSIAWDSGAVPVIVLTKSDLCDDLPQAVSQVENISSFSDVIPLSMFDADIGEKFQPYFQKNQTCAFIGSSGVGKSTLINKLLGENRLIVSDIAGTTRDAVDTEITYNGKEYVFIDTAGLRRKNKIKEELERYMIVRTVSAVERAEVVVLMIDAEEGVTEQDAKIAGIAHERGKATIIVVNKWDAIEKDDKTIYKFTEKVRNTLSFMPYAELLFVSAKTGQRLPKLFETIDIVSENHAMRVATGVLNEIMAEAVAMQQPPSDKGKRLRLYYITQVAVKPPTFVIFVNDKELMHFSYTRYIENQIRTTFGFRGTPIHFIYRERKEK